MCGVMRAEHRMREVAVTPNILHILQAANPDMDMSQILNMMQMAWEADDPPIPHVHRGGPRPAATADPFAPGNLAAAAILAHGQLLDTAAAVQPALAAPDGHARQPDDSATAEAASVAHPHSAEQPGSGGGETTSAGVGPFCPIGMKCLNESSLVYMNLTFLQGWWSASRLDSLRMVGRAFMMFARLVLYS